MIFSDRFVIRNQRPLHTLRVVMACAIAFGLISIFKIPHSYWIVITIVVVMGPLFYFGAVIKKASQRLLGTIIGASLGLSLFLLPLSIDTILVHNLAILFILAIIMMQVIGPNSYAAVMAGVTLIIVATAGIGNVDVAVWRAVNVILGSLLSMVCSRLFFPSRAFIHYQVLIATFLEAVGDYYLIHTKKILGNEQPIHNNFDKLIENLVQQQSLLDHLAKEKKRFKKISSEVLNIERRILNMLELLIGKKWDDEKFFEKIQAYSDLSVSGLELSKQINKLSKDVDKGYLKSIPKDKIKVLHIQEHFENITKNNDHHSNVNFFGYFWLNNELARNIFKLSIELSKMFNHNSSH